MSKAKKNVVSFDDFRAGVFTSIAELMCQATAEKPITREQMQKRLEALHPDNEPQKLASTIKAQCGRRLLFSRHVIVSGSGKSGWHGVRNDDAAADALKRYTTDGCLLANRVAKTEDVKPSKPSKKAAVASKNGKPAKNGVAHRPSRVAVKS